MRNTVAKVIIVRIIYFNLLGLSPDGAKIISANSAVMKNDESADNLHDSNLFISL